MKRVTNLLLAFMVMSLCVQAQLKMDKQPSTGFAKAIETILSDFPYNYRHITGDLVEVTGDWHQYASRVMLPGAESCLVGVYHSELDTTASWQALMFRGETFKQAASAYKRLYQQLKHCRLKMVDGSVYYLDGDFEEATEEMDFITTALNVQTADERFREFHVELELLYKMDEWVVNLNMVSKKKDSEMRPDWMGK
jgi:virulence-associated protein VapD